MINSYKIQINSNLNPLKNKWIKSKFRIKLKYRFKKLLIPIASNHKLINQTNLTLIDKDIR